MRLPGYIGPSYTAFSPLADCEQLVNWYPEKIESGNGKNRYVFAPTPGLKAFTALPQSPVRGQFASNGRMWAVGGNRLYEIVNTGVTTDRGLVARDSNPATFCSSGDAGEQLFITSGDQGYILHLTTHVLTNPVSNVTMGGYINGVFLALDADLSQVKYSANLNGASWPALNLIERTDAPDPWVAMLVTFGEIWLFGRETCCVFRDTGAASNRFQMDLSAGTIPFGIDAQFSLAVLNGSPVWLAKNAQGAGEVRHAQGYSPVRISTHAIEHAIQGYTTTSDAKGFTYQQDGHQFYVLTFPTEGKTWVYDAMTGSWHERRFWDAGAGEWEAYRAMYHCFAFGKHLCGDRLTGAIYELSQTTYTDAEGQALRRLRRAPILSDENTRLFCSSFELDLEVGLGLTSGQGSDPQIMFRFSKDGSKTWSHERLMSAGAIGAYGTRAVTHRLGSARQFVFEVSTTDPIPWRVINAYVEVDRGDA